MTLSLELKGRQIEHFKVDTSRLMEGCASVCVKIVQKLLRSKERDVDHAGSPARHDAHPKVGSEVSGRAKPAPSMALPDTIMPNRHAAWEVVKQELVPPYVKAVSFTVARNDLTPDRQEDFKSQFPDVSIIAKSLPDDNADEVEAEFAAGRYLRQISTTETASITTSKTYTKPPSLDICITTVAEVVPATPRATSTATPKPSLLS